MVGRQHMLGELFFNQLVGQPGHRAFDGGYLLQNIDAGGFAAADGLLHRIELALQAFDAVQDFLVFFVDVP